MYVDKNVDSNQFQFLGKQRIDYDSIGCLLVRIKNISRYSDYAVIIL